MGTDLVRRGENGRADEYRDKNAAEQVNEGEAWELVYRPEAKERQLSGLKEGDGMPVVENFPQRDEDKGKTRDKVAQHLGVSERGREWAGSRALD